MNEYNPTNHAENLPDAFAKGPDSNIGKILSLEKRMLDLFRNLLTAVRNAMSIDTATGATLDLYGRRFKCPRGSATDEQYRLMLKIKIMKNASTGSIPNLVDCIRKIFGCAYEDITIIEDDEPCKITLISFPRASIYEAGFSSEEEVTELLKQMLPVGVTVKDFEYAGTFEFSDEEDVYDEDAGFGNTEIESIDDVLPGDPNVFGGTLGALERE